MSLRASIARLLRRAADRIERPRSRSEAELEALGRGVALARAAGVALVVPWLDLDAEERAAWIASSAPLASMPARGAEDDALAAVAEGLHASR